MNEQNLKPFTKENAKEMQKRSVEKRKENKKASIDVSYKQSKDAWYLVLINILPFALLILFFVFMSRGVGGAGGGPGGIFPHRP